MQSGTADEQGRREDGILQLARAPMFASTMDTFAIPDAEDLNAQVRAEIAAWRDNDAGEQRSNILGWHSEPTFFKREEPGLRRLQGHIGDALNQVVRNYWPDFDPQIHGTSRSGWVNVNGTGAFNSPHDHSIHDLSGSYYVSTPQSDQPASGLIEFISPVAGYNPLRSFSRLLMRKQIRVRPEAGQMIIFPSYLIHWVYPNLCDEDRISIAFNLSVTGVRPSND